MVKKKNEKVFMKNFKWVCLCISLLINSLFSEVLILSPENVLVIEQENASDYEAVGNFNIGMNEYGSVYKYRSLYIFDLSSINDNASISEVMVNYSMSDEDYKFKLTKVTSYGDTYAEHWNNIGNGTILESGIDYGNDSIPSNNFKNAVSQSLINNYLLIGALSEDENEDGSAVILSISLQITYSNPLGFMLV